MTEYIIDITIENISEYDSANGLFTFYIKIDKNGNVDIQKKHTTSNITHGPNTYVKINDNIPIPSYIINMIKNSFCKPTEPSKKLPGGNCTQFCLLNLHHYEKAIENIIILKEDIAKSQSTLIDLL